MTPLADVQMYVVLWLNRYFEKFGDSAPNRNETYLIITAKLDVYYQYKSEMHKIGMKTTDKSTFISVWNALYPRFINRPWCDIPGKCDTCFEIDRQRRVCQEEVVLRQLSKAHTMHRGGLFMLERLAYKRRCHEAIVSNSTEAKPSIMSIIIDGMDQHKCQIPYLGGEQSMHSPLSQHITGVKEHGVGLTLYRNLCTVSKGANLTIYCILMQLKSFYERHGGYPEKLYIQVDGGCENANKYVLALMDLLVVKRVCREIWYTRLPTGHTHEDIDACFGNIWSAFKAEPVMTMDAWKSQVEKHFEELTLRTEVKDIWIVPDYMSLFEGCIIRNLGRIHKDLQTQHQWRFLAVIQDQYFPLGCKTTFRAYSSDKVIEFIRKPKALCESEIGRYTGLEVTTLHIRWYPSSD